MKPPSPTVERLILHTIQQYRSGLGFADVVLRVAIWAREGPEEVADMLRYMIDQGQVLTRSNWKLRLPDTPPPLA